MQAYDLIKTPNGLLIRDTTPANVNGGLYFFPKNSSAVICTPLFGETRQKYRLEIIGGAHPNGFSIDEKDVAFLTDGTQAAFSGTIQDIFNFIISIFSAESSMSSNIWSESTTEVFLQNPSKKVVLGDYSQKALFINIVESANADLPTVIFKNSPETFQVIKIFINRQIASGVTDNEILKLTGLDGNTVISGTIDLTFSDNTLGQRTCSFLGRFSVDALNNSDLKEIISLNPNSSLAFPSIDGYQNTANDFFIRATNNDGDKINVRGFIDLTISKV